MKVETIIGDPGNSFKLFDKKYLLKIISNLHGTLWIGVLFGLTGIAGYSLNLQNTAWKILFILILLALASFISGFFLGFLFGIPKRTSNNESDYHLSNNLVDISDWLTKIIIGLGLVEIKGIPGALQSLGSFIQKTTNAEDSITIFSICCIIYFSIFGLYFGYNYIRLFLSGQYKGADDILLENKKKLSETAEKLQNTNLLINEGFDRSTKENLEKYNELIKTVKTEDEYTFEDWYYKGLTADDNKKYKDAIYFLEKAIELDNKHINTASAYEKIGLAYEELGNHEKSIQILQQVIKEFPTYEYLYRVYSNISVPLNKLGKYKNSVDYCDMSILLRQDYANGWYNKACSFALLKEKPGMITCLQRAIELNVKYKTTSIQDSDFKDYLNDEDFKKLVM